PSFPSRRSSDLEIVDMEMLRIIEHVVQVCGLHIGLEVNFPTFRRVAISAVASNAGCHVLTHVRGKEVCLIRRRVGIYLGGVMAAVGALIAIRLGSSAI